MSRCAVCGDPQTVAKGRCHCCYEYRRRNNTDRTQQLVARLTQRDIERQASKQRTR